MAFFLAIRDLRHDWRSAVCFVAALVGILAPLLVVFALKTGVIGGMIDRLVENPANRELIPVGAGAHTPEFFERLRARGDVAFVVPSTRSINASANLVRHPASRRQATAVPMVPSGPSDPLLDGPPVSSGRAYASAALLAALGIGVGAEIEAIIGREIDGRREGAVATLRIIGEVPAERFARPALFVALEDLLAAEAFRDRASITPQTWLDQRDPPDSYASFRLYAATLEDIASLTAHLEGSGLQVRARAENAAMLISFRDNLDLLFAIIAALAALGFWSSMAANLRGVVERGRVSFSLLTLLGMPIAGRRLVPVFQSVLLVTIGVAVALLLVVPFLAVVNGMLGGGPGQVVAVLDLDAALGTLAIGVLVALTASAWAVFAVDRIGPDEVLRHA